MLKSLKGILCASLLFSNNLQSQEDYLSKSCLPIHFRPQAQDGRGDELCPTQGNISEIWQLQRNKKNFLLTSSLQVRAVLDNEQLNAMGLCFASLEKKTDKTNVQGKQIGLKLRALDSCNVIYVMWRFYPQDTIVILRKLNENRHSHKDCGNEGYKTITSIPLKNIEKKSGKFHFIFAAINNNILNVFVDNQLIWHGPLERKLQHLHGPIGVRSDNGTFMFQLDDLPNVKKNCPI